MGRFWGTVIAALVLAACAATNDQQTPDAGGNHPNSGKPVGSACAADTDCDSPTTPECLKELKPLSTLAGVPAQLAGLGLTFPMGYCSSQLNCASDADCGMKGQCYRPFREVTPDTLRQLEMPLMVSMGSL